MIHDIYMPGLAHPSLPGKIVEWKKFLGDRVTKGETLLIVEIDKADVEVESLKEGYLAVILAEAGEEVRIGSAIALIAETEAEIEEARQQSKRSSQRSVFYLV